MNELKIFCKDNGIKFPKLFYVEKENKYMVYCFICKNEFKSDLFETKELAKNDLCVKVLNILKADIEECEKHAY